jgi:hypothetical protein
MRLNRRILRQPVGRVRVPSGQFSRSDLRQVVVVAFEQVEGAVRPFQPQFQ